MTHLYSLKHELYHLIPCINCFVPSNISATQLYLLFQTFLQIHDLSSCSLRMYVTCLLATYVCMRPVLLQSVYNFRKLGLLVFYNSKTFGPLDLHCLCHIHLQHVTATNFCHLYHVINEESPKTYACPSCIHHHTT